MRAVRELSEERCLSNSVRVPGVMAWFTTAGRVSEEFAHNEGRVSLSFLHRAGHPPLRGPARVGRDVAKAAPSSDKDSLRPAAAEENQNQSVSDKSFQSLFSDIFLREALVFCVPFFGKGTQTFKGARPIPLVLRNPRAQCGGERI